MGEGWKFRDPELAALDAELPEPEIGCGVPRKVVLPEGGFGPSYPCGRQASWLMTCSHCEEPRWYPICDRCRSDVLEQTKLVGCRICHAEGPYNEMTKWQRLVVFK